MNNNSKKTSLPWTGERYVSDLNSAQISYEHWHRYLYATQFVKGKDVLDIACGEGYGSNLLAETAKSVTGVDISGEAIAYANEQYRRSNLSFLPGSMENIPIAGKKKIDVVVSFESIEHVNAEAQELFLKEVKRLLRNDGIFIVSSPNKLFYSDIPKYKNEFHLREFYEQNFFEFLRKYFGQVVLFGQKIFTGSDMWHLDSAKQDGSFTEYHINNDGKKFVVSDDKKEALYLIAVCSDSKIKAAKNSFLVDKSLSALSERDVQIANLTDETVRRGEWGQKLDRELKDAGRQIVSLNQAITERDGQIVSLNQAITERDGRIAELNKELAVLNGQVTTLLNSWSWRLTEPLRSIRQILK
jgi:2-polyprenyl-3-methyl-5-hydroxy-6-metoxy-1,4-benzoquinol methylase